ncbi:MAG TPA: cytochrome c-type biogenesis protein [Anaerolineae bacterium]|nr:cytochrome c-type biogenesis protein [Anaerolineae bacterium]
MRSRSIRRVTVFCGALIGVLTIVGVAVAQTGTPPAPKSVTPDDVNRIARQLYCPVCENEPLDVCQTSACQQWRAQIGQLVAEGKTDPEIIQYFIDRYGLKVVGAPPFSSETIWLYLLPVVGLIAGAIYVIFLMRRMRARGSAVADTPTSNESGDDYVKRVERDLKKW